jgi:hypothetical protein
MKMFKNSYGMKFIVPCLIVSLATSNLRSVSLHDGAEVAAKTTSGVGFAAIDALIDTKVPSTINKDTASLVELIKGDGNINFKRLNSFVKTIVDATISEVLKERKLQFLHEKYIDFSVVNKLTKAKKVLSVEEEIAAENTLNIIKATIPAIATQFAKNKFANKDKELMKSYILAELKAIVEHKAILAKEAGLTLSLVNFENAFGKNERFTDLLNFPQFVETITKFVVSDIILSEINVLKDKNYPDSMLKRVAVKSISKIITKIVMEIASPTIKVACKKATQEYTRKFSTTKAAA